MAKQKREPLKERPQRWIVDALADRGFKQSDLARAWDIDDAVVSRFITTGKPDITVDRILVLAGMLALSSDEIVRRIAGGLPKLQIPKPSIVTASFGEPESDTVEHALSAAQASVKRVQELLPHAKVHFSVVLNNGGEK